ncbi:hypothetical protein [Gloeobacter violaceus]|uniref:Gll4341 protein n=1 Tax=Gloeobacter violaceus (strain ATCC 29082 / PCC 7421) TaxID=251221 RepID=Q7ND95_GLOVI|nr:hypothetical protein [Gloeobacter violaceus]BAC92282.1 gll4341 [Gloeobacter violaceus PCC 7421]
MNRKRLSHLHKQLQKLAAYGPDWDGYGAAPVSGLALAAAEQFLQSEWLDGIASVYRPAIEPLHSGGLRIDWATTDPEAEDDAYVEVTIDAQGQIHWLAVLGEDTLQLDATVEEAAVRTAETLKT